MFLFYVFILCFYFMRRRITRKINENKNPNEIGQTVKGLWVGFISKETPRLKNWDYQQRLAYESSKREYII